MPAMNPISSSWEHPTPQRTPELDPSLDSIQGDLDIESYFEEFELLQPLDETQSMMTGRFGLVSHLDSDLPDATQPACNIDGNNVENPSGEIGSTSPGITEEDHWNPYHTPTFSDADHPFTTAFFSQFGKFDAALDGDPLGADSGCPPPDQLHPHEQSFASDHPSRFQPVHESEGFFQDLRRSWPSPSSLEEEPASRPLTYKQTTIQTDDDASSAEEKRAAGDYSVSYFPLPGIEYPVCVGYPDPDAVTSPLPDSSSKLSTPDSLDQENNQYYFVPKKEPRYVPDKSDGLFSDAHFFLDGGSQGAPSGQYTQWRNDSPVEELHSLSQTAQTSPLSDTREELPSYTSTPPERSFDITLTGPPSKGASHKPNQGKRATTTRKRKSRDVGEVENKPVKTMAIQIVQEDGLGGSLEPSACIPAVPRARRNGPLSLDGRRDAAMRRKDKSVCVWCRLAKKKCSGESPCSTCIEQAKTCVEEGKSIVFEQPCVKADFFQIVESGTCNYISQRAINHPTLDGSTRVRMELPATFEMKDLLELLDKRRGRINIRARQSWGALYVLDLNETYNYLKGFNKAEDSSHYDLREFIDRKILKFNKWTNCVKDCDPINNLLPLLSQWNNMPSRASYDFVPISDGQPDRPMDVHNPEDYIDILLAAQLSRIFCRKLEVDGYRALQNALNKNKWDSVPYDSFIKFVSQLGQILLTLRWRVSWWEQLGDGGTTPDANKERYEERVRRLCQVLYFYYTSVKLKLPAWSAPTQLDGVYSTYADAKQIWDDFPSDASVNGFDKWMARGKELIKEAGVQSRISKFSK
ncbi:hypothetical protein AJ79_00834 [Helicocarpus griseus UAMH5409]|uniref:Zn(2)-C6 fungal-type domain-containing protein n=1 Tax=Helicocarpus griseus UAMH5409 TaxID=1447875 RepID=A0A2B7Y9K6_9EURO|nr:hypothetical protein AJ79_00834 [Helicocarpus griseus UAMH5409]